MNSKQQLVSKIVIGENSSSLDHPNARTPTTTTAIDYTQQPPTLNDREYILNNEVSSSPFTTSRSSRSSSSIIASDSVDSFNFNNNQMLNSSLSQDPLEDLSKNEEKNYVFEINDYSKLTAWEKFVDQIESCIVTWCTNTAPTAAATRDSSHPRRSQQQFSDFSHHSQLLIYGGAKYRLTYFKNTTSSSNNRTFNTTSSSNSNFNNNNNTSNYNSSSNNSNSSSNNNNTSPSTHHSQTSSSSSSIHSSTTCCHFDTNFLLENDNDFQHRSHHLTRWFGVQEFLILSQYIEKRNEQHSHHHQQQHGKSLSKQLITTLLSAISIALSNTHFSIPYFVLCDGVHDYIGRFNSSLVNQITRFKSESLRKQLEQNKYLSSRYTKLSGIIELFCFNIGKHVKICNEIQIKARYNYVLESYNSQQWNWMKNNFSLKESRMGASDIPPLGCKYDPIHSITMACLFPNVLQHLQQQIDELNLTQSFSWEVRMNVEKRPELEHTDGLHRLLFDIYLPFKKTSFKENTMNDLTTTFYQPSSSPLQQQQQQHNNHTTYDYIHEAIFDIFDVHHDDDTSSSQFMKRSQQHYISTNEITSYIPKSCSPSSLLRRLCDHLPKMKNMSDIGILWKNFIRILFKFWEETNIQDLSVLAQIAPDQSFIPFTKDNVSWTPSCLLEQKIDMLNVCCKRECELARKKWKRKELKRKEWKDSGLDISEDEEEEDDDEFYDVQSENDDDRNNTCSSSQIDEQQQSQQPFTQHSPHIKQVLEISNGRKINIPITQYIPTKTEDVIEEEQHLLSNMESSQQRARYQCEGLLSDMQAFKYVNPNAEFSDFLLWYSPKDVVDANSNSLSSRMSSQSNENIWKQFWEEAQPIPVSKQKPLFDHKLHAEKVIHYLDTIEMTHVMDELIICSLVATYYSLREWWMDIIHNNESMMLLQETKKDLSILSDDFSESRTPVITKIEERFAFIRELLKKLSKETILQQTDLLEVLTEKLQDLEKSISLVISVLSKFHNNKRWLSSPFIHFLPYMEQLIFNESFCLTSHENPTSNHHILCQICAGGEEEEENENTDTTTTMVEEKKSGQHSSRVIHATEHAREFILRCQALRPYLNSDATPQLLYALVSRDEIRVSIALTEKVPW